MTLCALIGLTALGLSACGEGSPVAGTYLPNSSIPLQDEGVYLAVNSGYNRGNCIAAADWDMDEDIDVLASDGYGEVYLYENDGWDNFTKSQSPLFSIPSGYNRGCSLDVIDIDLDGDLDVLSSDGYGEVHLYRNQLK